MLSFQQSYPTLAISFSMSLHSYIRREGRYIYMRVSRSIYVDRGGDTTAPTSTRNHMSTRNDATTDDEQTTNTMSRRSFGTGVLGVLTGAAGLSAIGSDRADAASRPRVNKSRLPRGFRVDRRARARQYRGDYIYTVDVRNTTNRPITIRMHGYEGSSHAAMTSKRTVPAYSSYSITLEHNDPLSKVLVIKA